MTSRSAPSPRVESSFLEVFAVASSLGVRSFGGPVAHLGYFRREYVERRGWLDEPTYAELVALCSFLPGPTSSEVGIAIGLLRAGPLGAFAAWLGFTWPSFALLVVFSQLVDRLPSDARWIIAVLQIVALVVVALAVWRMARVLTPDTSRRAIAIAAAIAALLLPSAAAQVAIIAAAALAGWRFLRVPGEAPRLHATLAIGRRVAVACLAIYLALLLTLPLARAFVPSGGVMLVDPFYRSGALVFGGGHVVLPLLRAEIPREWVSDERFVAGYGAAQLVPGPLFTFAGYLGAVISAPDAPEPPPSGFAGALLATVSIFLPGFLLVFAALPSWGALRAKPWAQSALRGVNAAVVGLLLAALVNIARAIASAVV